MPRFLTIFILALCLVVPSFANIEHGKVVLVTIGSTSLNDITASDLPNISKLIDKGAIGVMNAKPASVKVSEDGSQVGRYSLEGGCATIGAGTRMAVTTDARKAFNATDTVSGRPARELYTSLYGQKPGSAEILHLGMHRLLSVNEDASYQIVPGALGSQLHKAKLKTAAIGNGDTSVDFRREATLIAVDSNGLIDYGDIGSDMIKREPSAPYGIVTSKDAVLSVYQRVLPSSDFILVDIGDTARASSYAKHCFEDQAIKLRKQAIRNADSIIGGLLSKLDLSKDRVIIVSPNPSMEAVDELDYLPPVIMAGKGIEHGILTSGSTRLPGIITNADISASVLDYFGIDIPAALFVGRSVAVDSGNASDVISTNNRIIKQIERQPLMRVIAGFLIAFVLLITVLVWWKKEKVSKYAVWAALLPEVLFLAVLWLPGIVNSGLAVTSVALIGLVIAIFIVGLLVFRSPMRMFYAVCVAIILTMIFDLFHGTVMLRDSIMSYTPVDGARYYGMGNEHMGSAIGAALIGAGFLATSLTRLRKIRLPLLTVLLLFVVALIGLPNFGANAGGGMAAVVAVAVGLMLFRGKGFTKKDAILAALSVPAIMIVMVLFDKMHSGGTQSHVGRAVQAISGGGMGEVWIIIARKISMNLMLLQHSAWSKLLIASFGSVVALFIAQGTSLWDRLKADQNLYSGLIGAAVGTVAALAFNDSGVVAAAIAFMYVWTTVLMISVSPVSEKKR